MRILYINHTDHAFPSITGGAVRYIKLFPIWIKEFHIDITILDNQQIQQGEFYHRINNLNTKINYLLFPYYRFFPYYLRFLYHICLTIVVGLFHSGSSDLIFSDYTPLQLIPASVISFVSRTPLIVTIQLIDPHCQNAQYKILRFLLRQAKLVLCCNPYYINFISHSNIQITRYAVDENYKKIDSLKKKYDLCFIGTVENDRKGISTFVSVSEKLFLSHLAKKSLIITQSRNLDYLNSLIHLNDAFIIKKDLAPTEVNRCLNESRVFFFPTQIDSFGLVIGEALKAGIPAVVSTIPELKIWDGLVTRTDAYEVSLSALLSGKLSKINSKNKLLNQTWEEIALSEYKYMRKLL